MAALDRRRLSAPHRPAVPFPQRRLFELRRFPRPRWPPASARRLKRERREALSGGISIDWLTGSDLTEAAWDDFFAFYMDTGGRKWGRPYLNRRFFSLIGERMAEDILLVMARRGGRYIAGAINFIGSRCALWPQLGLHRGSSLPAFRGVLSPGHRFRDRQRAEGGRGGGAGRAQAGARLHAGRPCIRRTTSPMRASGKAVGDYLARERREVAHAGAYLEEHGPFRKGEAPASD